MKINSVKTTKLFIPYTKLLHILKLIVIYKINIISTLFYFSLTNINDMNDYKKKTIY